MPIKDNKNNHLHLIVPHRSSNTTPLIVFSSQQLLSTVSNPQTTSTPKKNDSHHINHPSLPPFPYLTQSCSIKSGANCWKHDIPNGKQPHTMTVGECCATCTNTTLCKAFTLDIDTSQSGSDNASLGICYLKYSCGKQLYSVPLPITHSCHCHVLTSSILLFFIL